MLHIWVPKNEPQKSTLKRKIKQHLIIFKECKEKPTNTFHLHANLYEEMPKEVLIIIMSRA